MQNMIKAWALSQQIAGSVRIQAQTRQLYLLLQASSERQTFEQLVQVLEVLGKRRRVELEKLVQQMSQRLGPTFVPIPAVPAPNPSPAPCHPIALLSEAQNLLAEYQEKYKVVQCSAWQSEAYGACEIAGWLRECCQRLQQDIYFLESALSKARHVLKAEVKGRAAY